MKFIDKETAQKVLNEALATGADFAELFFEHTVKNRFEMTSKVISDVSAEIIHGVSLRILRGEREIFGYVNDQKEESLLALAHKLRAGFDGTCKTEAAPFVKQPERNIISPLRLPSKTSVRVKTDLMKTVDRYARAYSEKVCQVINTLTDTEQNILVCNSRGVFVHDLRTNVRLFTNVVGMGAERSDMQSVHDSIGDNKGYELFDDYDLKLFSEDVARGAVAMAEAEEMTGGTMTVVVHNAFGGVLLHEACVHSLEATSVAKGVSVFTGKLGQKIASDIVTAIDDGSRPGQWGSLNFDDEGEPTRKNILIENGILKSYLVDYKNSRIMNHPVTGNGRRQSYCFSPTSRMTNTFFAPGKDKFEDIIAATESGFFARRMGGGSVNPATGEFNFSVAEGYLIENGKITKPVRGAALVGNGAEILKNIDMIADNLSFGHGMCGSLSGSIPADVGQPTIRVQKITVGGRGGR